MPQPRKHVDHAARQAAYRKRHGLQKRAALESEIAILRREIDRRRQRIEAERIDRTWRSDRIEAMDLRELLDFIESALGEWLGVL